ncbi:MAG: cytochrome b/b6 domain-containing protein [Cyanobacteria bacterium P01_D01_bin.156]
MKPKIPYQPFLLRFLHGLTGCFLLLAMASAFWTYNTYDGRWGKLPLPRFEQIEGIHGTFGLYTLLIFPALVLYAFGRGHQRLGQPKSLLQLTHQVGTPKWWYTLSRCVNTVSLLALTFALFSGKMMDEKWLPQGDLEQFWYYAHLVSWLVMAVAIAMHLLMNAKVGGTPFLLSMLQWQYRPQDSPKLWKKHMAAWWSKRHPISGIDLINVAARRSALEILIWFSLIAAWTISIAKELSDMSLA